MPVRRQRSLTAIEVVVSTVVVGVMLVAALNTVGAARMGEHRTAERGRGVLLAQDLMSEILAQSYEEPVDEPAFGRESDESGGERTNYDDVDDYDEWDGDAPEYKDGTTIPGLDDWVRSVTVEWVSSGNLAQAVGSESGVKRITVTVEHNDVVVATLVALRTAAGPDFEDTP